MDDALSPVISASAHNTHAVCVSLRSAIDKLSKSDLKISRAYFARALHDELDVKNAALKMDVTPRDSHYTSNYGIQIALCVSLRSATNQETPVLDHTQREGTDTSDARPRQLKSSTTWKIRAQGRARRSYLRIDVSLNTLFIFVRYIPTSRESSPR